MSFVFILFLRSEDEETISPMVSWAHRSRWQVHYTSLFDRSLSSSKLNHSARRQERIIGRHNHHELEYLSVLLNTQLMLLANGWVCTLKSNSCRVIDELRVSIVGKLRFPFADLSAETCSLSPCVGKGIFSLDW